MLSDFRFGVKLLLKEKAFTVTALLTLALCIGANTAIFTVLNAVVLEPLPFPEPERLVVVGNSYPGIGYTGVGSSSGPDYLDRRQLTDVFDSVAAFNGGGVDFGGQRIDSMSVTPSFFQVLRAAPAMGRPFTEQDAVSGQDRVVILSHGLWKELLGQDPAIVGKDVRLSGNPYRVVGVMPESFAAPGSEARLWLPLVFQPQQMSDSARHSNNFYEIARLRPGVALAAVQQRLAEVDRRNLERFPEFKKLLIDARFASVTRGMKDEMVKDVRPTLYLVQAAVAFVLLIGCVNIANLLLVRANVRAKELAIRFSLGAGRIRLARQLLTESVVLSVVGGAFGVFTGYAGVRLLTTLGARTLPRGASIEMNGAVMAFSAGIAVLTGIVFGSIPVYHLLRRDLNGIFRGSDRGGTAERRAVWTRSSLVVCQVSLAFVLLIGAGLLTLSFSRLLSVDPGFRPQNLTTAAFSLGRTRYPDEGRARATVANVVDRVAAIPGVERVGVATALPLSKGHSDGLIRIDGYVPAPGEPEPDPLWNGVNAGYFQAMGIPLREGRIFTDADSGDAPLVAIIDETFAKRYWKHGSPIGAGLRQGIDAASPRFQVVAVVGSVKASDLAESDDHGMVYFHYRQRMPGRTLWLGARAAGGDGRIAPAIREELRRVDPEVALFDVKSMEERLSLSMRNRRAAMSICLVFAGLALALSAIGIYGVLAYSVAQRTREFGIRIALGAGAGDVLSLVLGHGMKLALVGLAIGGGGAVALTRLMTSMLFHVKPTEPAVFGVVAGALVVVALAASLAPSVRALRIHPSTALRYE